MKTILWFGSYLYKGNKKALIPKGDKRYQSLNPKQIIQHKLYVVKLFIVLLF